MAVKFLIDADISPDVASGLRSRSIDARAVSEVMNVEAPDEEVFRFAAGESRIVVTYNTGDFARLLGNTLRDDRALPGVVFVSARTIPSSDLGGLIRGLAKLAASLDKGEADASGGLFLTR